MRNLSLLWGLLLTCLAVNAQHKEQGKILEVFLVKENIDSGSVIILHGSKAWRDAGKFNGSLESLLVKKAIINEERVEMVKTRHGPKWMVDSIMLSGKEKHFIDYKMHNIQYTAKTKTGTYKFSSPVVVRDSVCFFYYERSDADNGSRCIMILKRDQGAIMKECADWKPWIKEDCSRWAHVH